MKIGADARSPDGVGKDAIELVDRGAGVATPGAAAESRINPEAARQLRSNAAAETLKKVLLHQARAHQARIKGGRVAKVVVIQVERKPRIRLHSNGEEALGNSRCPA